MDERDPLILTLELEPALFALLNGLREAHFPPERNLVPAHITLFHALPGAEAGSIADELATRTAHTAPLSLALPTVRFLGRGVALEVVSPSLVALRQTLAQTWAPWLSRQDQQGYRPHVTIQNKVPPEAARRLYDELTPRWQALAGRGEGLCLWYYRGGPWGLAARFPFFSHHDQDSVTRLRRSAASSWFTLSPAPRMERQMTAEEMPPHAPYLPIPYEHYWRSPNEQLSASRDFLATMARRRTVRDFAPTPVPFELIENAIRAAALAPSGANQQPWTFVVVSDPELKRQLREAAEAEERESYERRMSQRWLDALAPLGTDWRKPHITDAPYVIVVFEQPYGLAEGPDGVTRVKHYYVKESVGIAVGFLLASLTHAGLCTLTHTPSPMGFLATLLGRPSNERPYLLIPVGYPAEGATVPAITKKPLEEVLVHLAGSEIAPPPDGPTP